jgi:hypothetical protein
MSMRPIVLALSAWMLLGCAKKEDVVIAASDTVQVSAADIDRDPVALLPTGAIGTIHVDAPSLFQSQFGPTLLNMVTARLPIPANANFDPKRDLSSVFIGLYSMQGADSVVIATGTFHPDLIEQAADGTTMTPLGAPLVKTTYSKQTLYVSRNVGFAVLTPQTVLCGDETGIRRALDRLSQGQAKHDIPTWIDDVMKTPNAPVAAAFDFAGQAPAAALVKNLQFLQGVRTARLIGNFAAPGMNFAGTLSYATPDAAGAATVQIQQANQMLQNYSLFLQLAGIGNPLQGLKAQASGSDTQFVVGVDGKAINWALGQAANQLTAAMAGGGAK